MAENHQNIPAEPVVFEQRKCQHCLSEEYSSLAIFSAFVLSQQKETVSH